MLRAYGEGLTAVKALGENPSAELVRKIEARMLSKLRKVAHEYPDCPVSPTALIHPDLLESEKRIDQAKAQAETFHFIRHLKPLSADLEAVNTGNRKARARVYRTAQDLLALNFGQGPLKPPKANLDHADIFTFGWGMGLENLTWEELTVFFDENCWCGEPHDPNALRRQAMRFAVHFLTS